MRDECALVELVYGKNDAKYAPSIFIYYIFFLFTPEDFNIERLNGTKRTTALTKSLHKFTQPTKAYPKYPFPPPSLLPPPPKNRKVTNLLLTA